MRAPQSGNGFGYQNREGRAGLKWLAQVAAGVDRET
jgi:hypothetical protein